MNHITADEQVNTFLALPLYLWVWKNGAANRISGLPLLSFNPENWLNRKGHIHHSGVSMNAAFGRRERGGMGNLFFHC
jgi:hypothetical protein